jgi:tetratricopeptide (TPR) repeat protein
LERAPRAASLWQAAGDRYAEVFAHSRQAADRDWAIAAYRRAVELYPNKAAIHARLAMALRAGGQRDAARREAAAALRLDDLNPHQELRLSPLVRKQLVPQSMIHHGDAGNAEKKTN